MVQTLPSEYQTRYERGTSVITKLDAPQRDRGPEKCTQASYLQKGITVLVFIASSLIVFWNLGNSFVSQVDEERHIQVVREMVQSNDYWHLTFLDGEPYYHKPPLKFWLAALVVEVFGDSLSSHRAVDGFSGVVTAVLIFILVVRVSGLIGGICSVGALFSCQSLFLAHGFRDAVQDGLLVALTSACFVIGSLLMRPETSRRADLYLLFGILGGLAVLTKSVAGFLPLISLLSYCVVHRRGNEREYLLRYLIPYFTIPLLYFIPHCVLVDDAFETLVGYEIVGRLFTGYHNKSNPIYYVQLIASGSYAPPPLLLIPTFLWAGYWTITAGRTPVGFLLWSSVVILLLMSLAQSRLPHYIYPLLPLFAALCGMFVSQLVERGSTVSLLAAGIALALIGHGSYKTVQEIALRAEPPPLVRSIREVGQAHNDSTALISNRVHVPQSLVRDIELHFTRTVQQKGRMSELKQNYATDLLIVGASEFQNTLVPRVPRSYVAVSHDVAPDSSLLLVSYTSSALSTKPIQRFAGTQLLLMGGYGWSKDQKSEQNGHLISVETEASLVVPGDLLSEHFPVLLQLEVQVLRPSLVGALSLEISVNGRRVAAQTLLSAPNQFISQVLPRGVLRDGRNVVTLRQTPTRDDLAVGMRVRSLSLKLLPAS